MNNSRINRIRETARRAARIMPDTFTAGEQMGGLMAFFASQSPVRASIEFIDGKEIVIETEDGAQYAFTHQDVLRKFGCFEAYIVALDERAQGIASAPADKENTLP